MQPMAPRRLATSARPGRPQLIAPVEGPHGSWAWRSVWRPRVDQPEPFVPRPFDDSGRQVPVPINRVRLLVHLACRGITSHVAFDGQ